MSYRQHYAVLFDRLEDEFGRLEPETITGIIGFSAGGPVSMCKLTQAALFVTCELSMYDEQKPSSDGIRFELFSKDDLNEKQAQTILTALGAFSMDAQLGNNHTVDVSVAEASVDVIKLELYSTSEIDSHRYGLYRVRPHRP
jgi:hypothetical protein